MTHHYNNKGYAWCGAYKGELGGVIDCPKCLAEVKRRLQEDRMTIAEQRLREQAKNADEAQNYNVSVITDDLLELLRELDRARK